MADDPAHSPAHAERPDLLLILGGLALIGCLSLAAGTVIASVFVPGHDWVADTISDLAAGKSEFIMDFALYGFAAGLLATALAGAHAHLGGKAWSTGVIALALLAGVVTVVGARDEYGDSDTGGVVIHIYLVYALGLLFVLVPLCLAPALKARHQVARRVLLALTLVWALAAPVFFFLPTSIDGLYERALGVIACAMIVTLALVFIGRARAGPGGG